MENKEFNKYIMPYQNIETQNTEVPAPEEPINLPDPDYVPPLMMTSKKAKKKVANHLNFLQQLTDL